MSDAITEPVAPGPSAPLSGSAMDQHLADLNPMQRQAVDAMAGPVLVLAGAGTGKTRVLTTRLANLLDHGEALPWSILAVTFTNKAAREMRERVAAMVGHGAEQVWLGTFHSIGARMLRRHAEYVGLKSNFTILDTDDQVRLLKQISPDFEYDVREWPARVLIGAIQRWKDRGLKPADIEPDAVDHIANGKLPMLYQRYQDRLLELNAVDFGDLLLHCLTILRENPEILQRYHRQFSHILVDEYQDTNVAQYLWLRLLAQDRRNICCVGDDDQSIYGWRGAEVGNILRFETDFPGAEVIRLEQNYRSTSRVLAVASGLIAHNQSRHGKTLWTADEGGEKLVLRETQSSQDEAVAVVDRVQEHHRRGVPLKEMAVLVRIGAQTREFEEQFLGRAIPYQLIGGTRFYERQEIRDAIAYLRVMRQPHDDLAFERIINKPRRGFGPTSLHLMQHFARARNVSLWDAAVSLGDSGELRPAVRRALESLLQMFEAWRASESTEATAVLTRRVLVESGYIAMLEADKAPEAPGRLENLTEFVNAAGEFESIGGFLEHVSLVMESAEDRDSDKVSVMTMHAAKGLEFDIVFLPGWEDGIFPNRRALDENETNGLEEERRLAYVGLTRARKLAEISFATMRTLYGSFRESYPSRFLMELPAEHIQPANLRSTLWRTICRRSAPQQAEAPLPAAGDAPPRSYPRYRREVRERPAAGADPAGPVGSDAAYAPGDRVLHQKFGMGTVTAADGLYLDVTFDHAGGKRLVASFVSRP